MFQIGEIVWGRVSGFPWWPARIVKPTTDRLKTLSVSKIPPNHRLVWFFNDKDRYTVLDIKCLSPFSNPEYSAQTKKKTGKSAKKLKLAFIQAVEEHRSSKTPQHDRNSNSAQHRTQSPRTAVSTRNITTKLPESPDDQSEPLSAKTNHSPSNSSSKQTTVHPLPSQAASKRNFVRLRIREPHSEMNPSENHKPPIPVSHLQTGHTQLNNVRPQNGHSTSNHERSRRASKPSLKLRHEVSQKNGHSMKKRTRQTSHGPVKRIKLETTDLRAPDAKFQSQRNVVNRDRDSPQSNEPPLSKSRLSMKSEQITNTENADRSKLSLSRSRRVHRTGARYDECNSNSAAESEDDDEPRVGSKRSRGVEAPRLSDGQRRFHIRLERNNDVRTSKKEDEDRNASELQRSMCLTMSKISNEAKECPARSFEALTKDQCVTIIRGMQGALRCKNVRIWLQGYRLVNADEVKRTEKDLIQACEPGIVRAEKLVRWAKRHQDFDSGAGSRFSRMEERAVQECMALIDVYFDRRKVSLREIGCRVFQLTKELPAYSRRLTAVLEELLVLWVDLTSRS